MRNADEARGTGSDRLSRAERWIVALCTLAYLLDGVVHTVLGPLAPEIARTLGLSNATLGPIFSANLIGQCAGLLALPLLAGRIGHSRVVTLCLFGFGLFQLVSGAAQTSQQLFALRLATGFFLGGALPSCLAMVAAAAPPNRRGLTVTIMFVGYGVGCMLAGLIIVPAWAGGWRSAMTGIGVACLAAACLAAAKLRDPAPHARQSAAPGGLRLAAGLFAPLYLAGTLMLWLLFIALLTISYCLNSWLPILLVQVGRDPSMGSMALAIFNLGGIVSGLIIGLLIDRFGHTRVLVIAMSCASLLLLWIGQVLATASPVLLLALLGICGFFALGSYAGINVVLANFYPADLRATGIGLTKSIGRVGTILAPILIGLGLSAGMAEVTVMSLFAAPAAIAVAALLAIAAVQRDKAIAGQ